MAKTTRNEFYKNLSYSKLMEAHLKEERIKTYYEYSNINRKNR